MPIPSSSKLPSNVFFRIVDVALDLAGIARFPATGLESQNALLSSPMIRDFHIAIVVNLWIAHDEVGNTRRYFLPAVVLSNVSFAPGRLVVVWAPFLRKHKICVCYTCRTDLE